MNKVTPSLVALLALLLSAWPGVAVAQAEEILSGEYRWNSGRPSKLKAIFTATSDVKWEVAFHFRHNGQPHVYRGTAEGRLDGELRGKVTNEGGGRKFTFRLENDGGKLSGTHAEVFGRRERSTGTLTLRRPGRPSSEVI